jgi:hypothetical protein
MAAKSDSPYDVYEWISSMRPNNSIDSRKYYPVYQKLTQSFKKIYPEHIELYLMLLE